VVYPPDVTLQQENQHGAITIKDDTIMILKNSKFPALTPHRPGQRETIIPRQPGRRGEHNNPTSSPLGEKKPENVDTTHY